MNKREQFEARLPWTARPLGGAAAKGLGMNGLIEELRAVRLRLSSRGGWACELKSCVAVRRKLLARMGMGFLCSVGMASRSFAPAANPGNLTTDQEPRWTSVAQYLAEECESQKIPGLSAAVVLDKRPAWSAAFGLADVENNVPATPQTVYRIASISKLITATAVLQLVGSGRISLNESIREFVPEFPDPGATMNIRHVLAHLSGIRTFKNKAESLNQRHFDRIVDALAVFKDDRLAARPGERFINSSLAYNLLGLLIERASVTTYDTYLNEWIFKPAGMTSSSVEHVERIVPRRARGYAKSKDGTLRNSSYMDPSISLPGEGVLSTAEDLARFAAHLLDGGLLGPELFQVMTTVHKTNSGTDEKYGLGCFVRELDGRRIVGHGGWQSQVSAFLLILPEQGAAVVILANLEHLDVAALCLRVYELASKGSGAADGLAHP